MEERKPISHLIAGMLIALPLLIFSAVMTFGRGSDADPGGGWIGYVLIIAGLIVFIQLYGKAVDYRASFGDYFSYGFKATTMVVLLFVVYLFALSFTMPEIKAKVLEATRLEMEKQKNVTDSEVDKAMEMTGKYFWVIFIGTAVFFFAFVGAIGSLIGAAVTKKTPKNPFEQTAR